MTYYNEHDPEAAAWLRGLIRAGEIPAGDVDERSIVDVSPHDLTGYTQQHFFAGIGGWPLALRLAGWPDTKPVRTGSCPCQPFSQTGLGLGEADARHLWPVFRDLIAFGEPTVTLGEQVASDAGRAWLAGVRADLEALGYEVGAADLCAAGVGAPSMRQRLFWLADPHRIARKQRRAQSGRGDQRGDAASRAGLGCGGGSGRLGNANGTGSQPGQSSASIDGHGRAALANGGACRMGDTDSQGLQRRGNGGNKRSARTSGLGFWADFELVACADGKQRRVEPGTFPLAHGIPSRVGPVLTALRSVGNCAIKAARDNRVIRLKGYGNAIVPELGAAFVMASTQALSPANNEAREPGTK